MNHILILIFSVFTLSCVNTKEVIAKETDNLMENSKVELLNGEYKVVQLGENKLLDLKVTLNFNQKTKTVSGFSGCNDFSGNYTKEENNITFLPLMATKRACEGAADVSERQLFKFLKSANTFLIQDNVLTLKGDDKPLIVAEKVLMENQVDDKKSKKAQENVLLTYRASTRGFFEIIWVTKDSISFCKDRDFKDKKSYQILDEDWNIINTYLQEIDLKTLPELKAPSATHTFDAAPSARFIVNVNEEEYTTTAFDHGNPPKVLRAIIDKIISAKNMAQKQ